ncbi:hypothetical protein OCOJLMKI_5320 [Methylobacterium iners]|uniref:Uncharacterized protein n=1 Tax=Methylobacterium iners TaxID=418707 RepID=A0ABQ4S4S1_9HYPH|nr:hypothetical protein OCOJLMKI_5320 [Methylobacterium iners]
MPAKAKPTRAEAGGTMTPTRVRAACIKASPATPPRPVGSGQRAVGGSALATALAAKKPMTQSAMRRPPRGNSRVRISCTPQKAGGRAKASAPSPRSCIARSETMAPGTPSTLWAGCRVAWLRLGSSIDQVASATVSAVAPANSTRPPSSVMRLAMNGRTLSR